MTEEETLERLIVMTNQTCMIALDKTLAAINVTAKHSYFAAQERAASIGERMVRTVHEVGLNLEPEYRSKMVHTEPPEYKAQVIQLRRA